MKSTLSQSQKAILAMSRAQYEQRCSGQYCRHEYRSQKTPAGGLQPENCSLTGDEGDVPMSLNIGVCIMRLDKETGAPVILLLRRSLPFMWRIENDIFISTSETQLRVGDWELPGGMVQSDDLSISSAMDRIVVKQTGLRVVKVLEMLRDVNWSIDIKALVGDSMESSDEEHASDARERRAPDGDSPEDVGVGGSGEGSQATTGSDPEKSDRYSDLVSEIMHTGFWSTANGEPQRSGRGHSEAATSYDEMARQFLSHGVEEFGIRIPTTTATDASSEHTSSWRTGTSASGGRAAILPTPQSVYAGEDDEYHSRSETGVDASLKPAPLALRPLPTNSNLTSKPNPTSNHHSWIPTTQLPDMASTPSSAPREQPQGLEGDSRNNNGNNDASAVSSLTLPSTQSQQSTPSQEVIPRPRGQTIARRDRPLAQVIPFKLLRARYVQINVVVLIDENIAEQPVPRHLSVRRRRQRQQQERSCLSPDQASSVVSSPAPGSGSSSVYPLIESTDGHAGSSCRNGGTTGRNGNANGEGNTNCSGKWGEHEKTNVAEESVPDCQHDEFLWATLAQVRGLEMHNDLRSVVFQAFSWFEDLSGDYI